MPTSSGAVFGNGSPCCQPLAQLEGVATSDPSSMVGFLSGNSTQDMPVAGCGGSNLTMPPCQLDSESATGGSTMPSVTGPSSSPFFLPYIVFSLCIALSCSCFDSPPNRRLVLLAEAADEKGTTLIDFTTASFLSFEVGFEDLMADGLGV